MNGRSLLASLMLLTTGIAVAAGVPVSVAASFVDREGTSHTLAAQIPYSDLSSRAQKEDFTRRFSKSADSADPGTLDFTKENISQIRAQQNAAMRDKIGAQARYFDVTTVKSELNGVPVYISSPAGGVAPTNGDRVLINLHGGSFVRGSGELALAGAIPIAGLSGIKVVSIDYRQAPELQYPAASEDVEKVYRALLGRYKSRRIGIFGCSSGALLTAEAVVWFNHRGLPAPGAIGLFGEGATAKAGDSNYIVPQMAGYAGPVSTNAVALESDWYFPAGSERIPLAFPADHPDLLKRFPPTLLMSGTRDIGLSQVVVTHARLINAKVEAELHVWEGATHCAYAAVDADPHVPETREAWNVIVGFFSQHLRR
jgi:acetyl esterase/lipase